MALGACPAAQTVDHLVDLGDDGSDVTEVGLDAAPAEVRSKGVFELRLVGYDCSLELFELFDPPFDGKGCTCAEEFALGFDDFTDSAFGEFAFGSGRDGLEDLLDVVISHSYG